MLHTVLHLLCGAPLDPRDTPPRPTAATSRRFTEVHVLATRAVYARALGRPHAVAAGERQRLVDLLATGRGRVLWEASATSHLLGLHAVHRFRPGHRVVSDGVLRMLLAQNADDGVPALDSEDVWLAAVAGLAFLDNARLRPLARRMADFVASWQAAEGGWPFASAMVQTDVDTATRCMELLRAVGRSPLRGSSSSVQRRTCSRWPPRAAALRRGSHPICRTST